MGFPGNRHQPVGAELVIHVCDLGVFVYQPAEQIPTSEMKVAMAMSQVTAANELFGPHRTLEQLLAAGQQDLADQRGYGSIRAERCSGAEVSWQRPVRSGDQSVNYRCRLPEFETGVAKDSSRGAGPHYD